MFLAFSTQQIIGKIESTFSIRKQRSTQLRRTMQRVRDRITNQGSSRSNTIANDDDSVIYPRFRPPSAYISVSVYRQTVWLWMLNLIATDAFKLMTINNIQLVPFIRHWLLDIQISGLQNFKYIKQCQLLMTEE